jgi:hypothetical protein
MAEGRYVSNSGGFSRRGRHVLSALLTQHQSTFERSEVIVAVRRVLTSQRNHPPWRDYRLATVDRPPTADTRLFVHWTGGGGRDLFDRHGCQQPTVDAVSLWARSCLIYLLDWRAAQNRTYSDADRGMYMAPDGSTTRCACSVTKAGDLLRDRLR